MGLQERALGAGGAGAGLRYSGVENGLVPSMIQLFQFLLAVELSPQLPFIRGNLICGLDYAVQIYAQLSFSLVYCSPVHTYFVNLRGFVLIKLGMLSLLRH
jgi:hypothetical protein